MHADSWRKVHMTMVLGIRVVTAVEDLNDANLLEVASALMYIEDLRHVLRIMVGGCGQQECMCGSCHRKSFQGIRRVQVSRITIFLFYIHPEHSGIEVLIQILHRTSSSSTEPILPSNSHQHVQREGRLRWFAMLHALRSQGMSRSPANKGYGPSIKFPPTCRM